MAASSIGGYSVEVIHSNDKERFKCMLCLQIIKDAIHGCMSHVFCKTCIMEYIKRSKNKTKLLCPAGCGISFDKKRLHSNNPIDRFVNQLACKCPDCNWKGELSDFIQRHEPTCEEKKVPCCLCKDHIKKKDLNKHTLETCRNRKLSCKYCLKQFCYTEHGNHEVACGNSRVDCFLKKFGCNEAITRKQINEHYEKSNQKHIHIVTQHFLNENMRLRSDNNMIRLKNVEIQNSLASAKKELQLIKLENEITSETLTQLKLENTVLQDANKSILEMTSRHERLDEKISQLENENIYLKNCLSSVFLRFLKPVLAKKAVKSVLELTENKTLIIKRCKLLHSEVKECFNQEDFSKIADDLTRICHELKGYADEVKELISTCSAIKICRSADVIFLYFKTDSFTLYEDKSISLGKIDDKYYFLPKESVDVEAMVLSLNKWNFDMTKENFIDFSKPCGSEIDHVPFTSNKYGCFKIHCKNHK